MNRQPTDSETDTGTTEANRRDRPRGGAIRWLSLVAALAGLWVLASPFVYEVTEMALWNNVVVGAAILLVAGYDFYRTYEDRPINVGSAGLAALLGLWLVAAPFLVAFESQALIWSTIVSGAVVAILSGYNAYRGREVGAETATGTRT